MTEIIEIDTSRLRLRQWRQEDYPAFASMNADAQVMQYFPKVLSAEESNVLADKFNSMLFERSWGFWAVEIKDTKKFIGFVGLNEPDYKLPVTPCVEVGWRIAKEYWGNGFATEAANAALAVAFDQLDLPEVYSFTPILNTKSIAVMRRLDMVDMLVEFEHPLVPVGNPLRTHVLYRIDKTIWMMRILDNNLHSSNFQSSV